MTFAPRAPLDTLQLVIFFRGHKIKWPISLRYYAAEVARRRPCTAKDLIAIHIDVLRYSNGSRWPTVFRRMSSGLMDATTGLATQAANMGMIARADQCAQATQKVR